MSYEIVKSIKIIPEKMEIRINSAPNNVRPLKYYSNKQIATTEEKFRENILYLLKDIDGGELALSNNKENSKVLFVYNLCNKQLHEDYKGESISFYNLNEKDYKKYLTDWLKIDCNYDFFSNDYREKQERFERKCIELYGEDYYKNEEYNKKTDELWKKSFKIYDKYIDLFIEKIKTLKDNNFELITQADYNEIFNQEYYYKDCLEKKE